MKKIIFGIWIAFVLILVCLSVNYCANEKMIHLYEKGQYEENKITALGFTEPYIAPYNQGNIYYQRKEYDKAIEAYQKALKKLPPHKKECKIRINMALSRLAKIDKDEITNDNVDDTMKELEEITEILYKKECAKKDGNGHNKDAQKLADEIEDFIEAIKNVEAQEVEKNSDSQEEKEKEKEKDSQNDQEKKEEQLKEIQKQSIQERNEEMRENSELEEYDYYNGQSW